MTDTPRRKFLSQAAGGIGLLMLSGCDRLGQTAWFSTMLQSAEDLNRKAHKIISSLSASPSRPALAQEFTAADISPVFRGNGTLMPQGAAYATSVANGFADWQLRIDGLVTTPLSLSMDELKAMPSRTQITRHDCVEGWSAIGQWTGVPLAALLALAKPQPHARYAVFHCADNQAETEDAPAEYYYESIDLDDAFHPQTLLAYQLNGNELPVKNGAPLRLRVERQLGYKHAKYLKRVELVESFAHIGQGQGGYWPDYGYQWYAGI